MKHLRPQGGYRFKVLFGINLNALHNNAFQSVPNTRPLRFAVHSAWGPSHGCALPAPRNIMQLILRRLIKMEVKQLRLPELPLDLTLHFQLASKYKNRFKLHRAPKNGPANTASECWLYTRIRLQRRVYFGSRSTPARGLMSWEIGDYPW